MNNLLQEQLLTAGKAGDLEMVRLLVSNGVSINIRDRYGFSLLSLSSKHPELVKFLLSSGANPNDKDYSESTPLHHAVWGGNKESISLMLDYGGDPRIRNQAGFSSYDMKIYNFETETAEVNEELNSYMREYLDNKDIKDPGCN